MIAPSRTADGIAVPITAGCGIAPRLEAAANFIGAGIALFGIEGKTCIKYFNGNRSRRGCDEGVSPIKANKTRVDTRGRSDGEQNHAIVAPGGKCVRPTDRD